MYMTSIYDRNGHDEIRSTVSTSKIDNISEKDNIEIYQNVKNEIET